MGEGLERFDVVEHRPVGAGDLEHVPEAFGHQHPYGRTLALEDGVGADGDAMHESCDMLEFDMQRL